MALATNRPSLKSETRRQRKCKSKDSHERHEKHKMDTESKRGAGVWSSVVQTFPRFVRFVSFVAALAFSVSEGRILLRPA
jgi:hypothetical protein